MRVKCKDFYLIGDGALVRLRDEKRVITLLNHEIAKEAFRIKRALDNNKVNRINKHIIIKGIDQL